VTTLSGEHRVAASACVSSSHKVLSKEAMAITVWSCGPFLQHIAFSAFSCISSSRLIGPLS